MPTYISLLRGINVGGNNKIKMAELKTMYGSLDFQNVETFIQSGNVIFDSKKKDRRKLGQAISEAIKTSFGFDVEVLLRNKDDFEWLLQNNPFASVDEVQLKQLYVMFFDQKPDPALVTNLMDLIKDWPEEFKVIGDHAFLYAVNGFGKTKLTGNFVERKLKVKATARNWNTVNVLLGKA